MSFYGASEEGRGLGVSSTCIVVRMADLVAHVVTVDIDVLSDRYEDSSF